MNIPKLITRFLLGSRLPQTTGEIQVNGLEHPVAVRRDKYGIPYILAQTEADAWYGLGFCQGQDRPFQLEMLLRVTRGTLSELIGKSGLTMDRLSRRIGFNRAAHGHARVLPEAYQPFFEAFVRGVNAGASKGIQKRPHAFAFLRTDPTPWEVADVFAGLNFVAFGLSTWSAKLTRLMLMRSDGPEAVRALDSEYPDWLLATKPVDQLAGSALDRLGDEIAGMMSMLGKTGASNNWALNGRNTKSGRPLLANDPHLAPALPAQWYLAHLRTPSWAVAGASFIGAPIIPSGHNAVAAWGVTAGLADNVDLYLEQLGPDQKTVREGDRFVSCEILRETFRVKGGDPFEDKVIITSRGPIVSDLLEEVEETLSMKAVWMDPLPTHGIIQVGHVQDFESFRKVAKESAIGSLNMVYADVTDSIGWQLFGAVPNRVRTWNTVPAPGRDPDFGWAAGLLPFDSIPHILNPETGFVATANNKPSREGEGPYLGRDWADGYRHARIVEMLRARSDWDLPAAQKMQTDQFSIPWREIKDSVLKAPVSTDSQKLALKLLRDWDSVVSSDSPAAAVYEFFVIEMLQRMAASKTPNGSQWALGRGFNPLVLRSFFPTRMVSLLSKRLREPEDGWFEAGWPAETANALGAAVERLKEVQGLEPERWAWGEAHPLVLAHPMGAQKPLDRVFNLGPFPHGGDHQTIAQAGRLASEFGSNVTSIPNLRMVLDVGNWDENRFVLAGGQSGNPFSPQYDDMLELWLRGEAVKMPWSEGEVEKVIVNTLTLLPD